MINVSYVRQGEPLGLGHAVLLTEELVGEEPFAVVLADDVIEADPPALLQISTSSVGGPVLAVRACRRRGFGLRQHRCRIRARKGIHLVRDLVEKPKQGDAPSNLAIIGRYVLTPEIFGRCARPERPDRRNPTDQRPAPPAAAAQDLRVPRRWHAPRAGNKLGYLKATVEFALRRAGPRRAVPRLPAVRKHCAPQHVTDGKAPTRPTLWECWACQKVGGLVDEPWTLSTR